MTEEQEQAVKEAHRQFLNKQQAVARERAEALPYLQSAMYNSTDPSASHYLEYDSQCPSPKLNLIDPISNFVMHDVWWARLSEWRQAR